MLNLRSRDALSTRLNGGVEISIFSVCPAQPAMKKQFPWTDVIALDIREKIIKLPKRSLSTLAFKKIKKRVDRLGMIDCLCWPLRMKAACLYRGFFLSNSRLELLISFRLSTIFRYILTHESRFEQDNFVDRTSL
jgi:hypothetical protein